MTAQNEIIETVDRVERSALDRLADSNDMIARFTFEAEEYLAKLKMDGKDARSGEAVMGIFALEMLRLVERWRDG